MTTWEGINEFVAVAETQSFTKASDKLSTSVAHISRKVSALKERLPHMVNNIYPPPHKIP